MRIVVMQGRAAVGDDAVNLDAIDEAARRAASDDADVLVTPELFVSGYAPRRLHGVAPDRQDGVAARLSAVAARHGVALVASHPEVVVDDGAVRQYIAATLYGRDGERLAHHRKVHLFGDDEPAAFCAAAAPPAVVDLGGLRVALAICFDVEFPETIRAAALAGADVVLAPTALAEGFDDVPRVLLRARALENGVAIAYANHTGVEDGVRFGGGSVVVGPDGRLLAEGGTDADVLVADLTAEEFAAARRLVPYLAGRRPDAYATWGLAAP